MKLRAHRLDREGRGIARSEALDVVVPGLLPGEEAEVLVQHRSPHEPVAWATIVRRLETDSPDRQPAACPGYGRCGGCSLQHLRYPAQLRVKRAWVEASLGVSTEAVVPAPEELGWRNKGKYVVARDGDRLVLGAYEPRTHAVVSTLGCRVVEPAIDDLATRLRDLLEGSGLTIYDEATRIGHLRYVVIRRGGDGSLLAVLITTSEAPRAAVLDVARAAGDVSVVWMTNDDPGGRILSDSWEVLTGTGAVQEQLSGVTVNVGPSDFFQVNRDQAQRLYDRVAELAGVDHTTHAVDLYGGLGGIAFSLARAGARVTGIEALSSAVDAARAAAHAAGLSGRVQFQCGRADSVADVAGSPDLIVVNPPRKGLSADIRRTLLANPAPTLVYVSCNPASLARDLTTLAAAYSVTAVEPFDLMPGATPIETVVLLRRETS